MAKKRKRKKNPQILADLLPGDRVEVESEWGLLPIRISWHQGKTTFARAGDAGEVTSYSSALQIIKVTKLNYEGSQQTSGTETDSDDPLLKEDDGI